MSDNEQPHFKGPGQWRSQAKELEAEEPEETTEDDDE